jgi:hypothetical protein
MQRARVRMLMPHVDSTPRPSVIPPRYRRIVAVSYVIATNPQRIQSSSCGVAGIQVSVDAENACTNADAACRFYSAPFRHCAPIPSHRCSLVRHRGVFAAHPLTVVLPLDTTSVKIVQGSRVDPLGSLWSPRRLCHDLADWYVMVWRVIRTCSSSASLSRLDQCHHHHARPISASRQASPLLMHSTKAWKIRLRGTRSLLSDRIGPIRSVFLSGKPGDLDRATYRVLVRGLDGPFWPSGFPIGEYHVVICCTSQLTVTSSSGYRCIESTLFNSFILQEIQTIFKRLEHEFYRPFRQDCHADLDYKPLHAGGILSHSIPKSREGSVVGVSVTLAV